jgi:hypothetical protein
MMGALLISPVAASDEDVVSARETQSRPPEIPTSKITGKTDLLGQVMVLTLLFAAPALLCLHAINIGDPDTWWHLRTGEWILQHHAVPRVDPFSGVNAGRPWQAYSWLFEVLTTRLFQRFGLVGIAAYTVGMVLAITVALRHLIQRLQSDVLVTALLTSAACFSLGHLLTPRPWLFTILFFVLEVDILMRARRTGRVRELLWLPVIFALWSNVHIQFIDGLVVLAIVLAEAVVARWGIGERTRLQVPSMLAASVASVAATLVNPYGWKIYRVAYDLAAQSGVLDKIAELKAMRFRDPSDFCVLFLALAAAGALARRRRLPMFETVLLGFAAVVSFRSERDVWVMAVAAVAIVAATVGSKQKPVRRVSGLAAGVAVVAAALAAALAVALGFRVMHVSNAELTEQAAKGLPVRAVEAIRAKHYPGPLYNDFDWGGYLIWALRMPVSIDGRAAFYGDAAIDRSIATWNAQPDWASDPALMSAGLVIGPAKAPLMQILRMDSRFELVFEDELAAVFVARK